MKNLLPLLSILIFAFGCDTQECEVNERNEVLRENDKTSVEYQRELARLSLNAEADEMEYFFEEMEEHQGQTFLVMNTFGPDFCGVLRLVVNDPQLKSKMQPNDETGFVNGEVEGLEFEVPNEGYPVLTRFEEIDD